MSSLIVDTMASPWTADATALWSLSVSPASSRFGEDGLGMAIVARSGANTDPAPFAERRYDPPIDLGGAEELRFWLRSSQVGDGGRGNPLYLAFEVASDALPPDQSWQRLLPVKIRERWELHRLWLADMPASLRQAVGILRLRSLNPTVAFTASMDDLIAATPEPLQDVEAALLARLDRRFQVPIEGTLTDVPALIDVPENPGERTLPYLLIIPWSIQVIGQRGGSGEIIDNHTANGAFVRPSPQEIQLEYCVDAFVQVRSQKTLLLEQILGEFGGHPHLVVNGEPLEMTPFVPSPEQVTHLIALGRTPLFYRLSVWMEAEVRQFRPWTIPLVLTGPKDGRETAEAVTV